MEPKEKAKELVKEFINWAHNGSNEHDYLTQSAKQCAMIYAKGMINEYAFIHDKVLIKKFKSHEVIATVYHKWLYWKEVKTQITKL